MASRITVDLNKLKSSTVQIRKLRVTDNDVLIVRAALGDISRESAAHMNTVLRQTLDSIGAKNTPVLFVPERLEINTVPASTAIRALQCLANDSVSSVTRQQALDALAGLGENTLRPKPKVGRQKPRAAAPENGVGGEVDAELPAKNTDAPMGAEGD